MASNNDFAEISKITSNIFLSAHCDTKDIQALRDLDIKLIINTTVFQIPHKVLKSLDVKVVTTPYVDSPLFPIPIFLLNRGVEYALEYLNRNQNVLVYCKRGVHRSVAMVCCILIAQGYTSNEAFKIVKENRKIADPEVWYIKKRILKFENSWKDQRPRS